MRSSGGMVALVPGDEAGEGGAEGAATEEAELDGKDDGSNNEEEDEEDEAGAEEDDEGGAPAVVLLVVLPDLRIPDRLPVVAGLDLEGVAGRRRGGGAHLARQRRQ